MFSDSHCRYRGPTSRSGFSGHEFQQCSQILTVDIEGLQVNLVLVDMSFNTMFSDSHYRYRRPTSRSGFSGHEFQHNVLRFSL